MRQIKLFCVPALLVLWFTSSCSEASRKSGNDKTEQSIAAAPSTEVNDSPNTTDLGNLFTLSDAEKILGEPAHLVDSESITPGVVSKISVNDSVAPIKAQASRYGRVYEANSIDAKTGRTGKVYFLLEDYPQISSATTVYSYYKRSNQDNPGFKEVHDLGDEAWFGNSPLFAYMRKGNKILVVKVNKMTSLTSFDGFNMVIKNITAGL